jgi:hypothetical protein
VDNAAQVISEIALSKDCSDMVFHLENPVRQSWHDLLTAFAENMGLQESSMVPFSTWLEEVCATSDDHNPAKKLAAFFRHDFERMSGGNVILGTDKARKASRTLRRMKALEADTIIRYLSYWKDSGLLV